MARWSVVRPPLAPKTGGPATVIVKRRAAWSEAARFESESEAV